MAAFVVDRDVLTGLVAGDVIVPGAPDYDIVRKTAMAGSTTSDRRRSSDAARRKMRPR